MSFEFFFTSLIVILLPGTGVLYTVAVGLGRGFKSSIAAAVGCTLGIVPAAVASTLGLAAIFHTSAVAFLAVKYIGVAYILYMAFAILKQDGLLKVEDNTSKETLLRTAVNGALLNVLNPKLSLFFLAFLPQFVPSSEAGSVSFLILLASIFMLLTFVVFVLYGGFASLSRKYIIDSPRFMMWLKRGFATTFGVLGLKLALSENQ